MFSPLHALPVAGLLALGFLIEPAALTQPATMVSAVSPNSAAVTDALIGPAIDAPADVPADGGVPFVLQQPAGPAPAQVPGGASSTQPSTPLPTPAASAKVTGSVTYRERMALPPDAIIHISLQDISRADAPATVLGEQAITAGGAQVPIPFEIAYDPAAIDQRLTYSVRARITVDGQLLFTSTTATLVLTRGNPSHVEIVLQHV